jgi:hypothetical protein
MPLSLLAACRSFLSCLRGQAVARNLVGFAVDASAAAVAAPLVSFFSVLLLPHLALLIGADLRAAVHRRSHFHPAISYVKKPTPKSFDANCDDSLAIRLETAHEITFLELRTIFFPSLVRKSHDCDSHIKRTCGDILRISSTKMHTHASIFVAVTFH